jgi:hypothetical protein
MILGVITAVVAESGMERMGKRTIFGAFCCVMLLSGSAWAATLQPGQGALSVNQGQGFQQVNTRIDANVGDSVMVGPGGSASVVYDDGCTVDVQPGSVTTIAPLSPCASGSNAQNNPNFDWGGAMMLAGAAAGVGIGAYEASKSGGSSSPASP